MPQTSYSLAPAVALAGMLADHGDKEITSRPAAEVIPPGRAVVIKSDGTVELPKTAGAAIPASGTGSLLGIAFYENYAPAGGYQIGDMVPILRKGRVWVDFSGTLATDNEAVNISHSSTVDTDRGKFTDAATSTTAGSEITAFSKGIARGNAGAALACVEINLP
jgi:hypothetical protein